jgi:hypothetical protein
MKRIECAALVALFGACAMPALAECPSGADSSSRTMQEMFAIQEAYAQQRSGLKLPDPTLINTEYSLGRLRTLFQDRDLPNMDSDLRAYVVISNRYQRAYEEEIVIPVDSLICILTPVAVILISDGIAHHYVGIEHIDRQNGVAYIIDGWPKESFLVSEELPEKSRGRLQGTKETGITIAIPIASLSQYLIGAMFIEGENFVQRIKSVHDLDKEPANLIALGLSVFRNDEPSSFAKSIATLRQADAVARETGDAAAERGAKKGLAYVLLMSALKGRSTYGTDAVNSYTAEYEKLEQAGFGWKGYSVDRLVSLADVYKRRKAWLTARQLASQAITTAPDDERGYMSRALILAETDSIDAALVDAKQAYRLNTARIRRVILTPGDDFVDRFFDERGNVSVYKEIGYQREGILFCLANGYSKKRLFNELLAVAIETEKLQRGSGYIEGSVMHAEALVGLGNREEARALAAELFSKGNEQTKKMLKSKLGELLPD